MSGNMSDEELDARLAELRAYALKRRQEREQKWATYRDWLARTPQQVHNGSADRLIAWVRR